MRAIETFEDLLAELKKYDVQDDPKTGYKAQRNFYAWQYGASQPYGSTRDFGFIIMYACEGGVFDSGRLQALKRCAKKIYETGLKDFLLELSELVGEDLLKPTDETAAARLIAALKKVNHRQPGKKYDDKDIHRFKDSITAAYDGNPRIIHKELYKMLGMSKSSFINLELNIWAKKCRMRYVGDFHGERRSGPHTRHGRADAERARQDSDND